MLKVCKVAVLLPIMFLAFLSFVLHSEFTNYQITLKKPSYSLYDILIKSSEEPVEKFITSDEIRAEQEEVLAQLAIRNSLHDQMTDFYVQDKVVINLFSE